MKRRFKGHRDTVYTIQKQLFLVNKIYWKEILSRGKRWEGVDRRGWTERGARRRRSHRWAGNEGWDGLPGTFRAAGLARTPRASCKYRQWNMKINFNTNIKLKQLKFIKNFLDYYQNKIWSVLFLFTLLRTTIRAK